MDRNLYNINILGIGFMLVFSAFFTASFIEATVFKDYNRNGINTKTGFYSLAIIYTFLGVANWFSPAVVKLLGTKWSLLLSSIPYTAFIFAMYEPNAWSVFILSAALGTGGGVLWTANGEVIAKNSSEETNSKNTGIFWSWFNASMLIGNIFLYFYLGDSTTITDSKRHGIYIVLGVLCTLGNVTFFLLRTHRDMSEDAVPLLDRVDPEGIFQPILDAKRFCLTWQMGLLYLPIMFTGVSLNFYSSVFITSIGSTFSQRRYLALGGICTGIGEIAAGQLLGRLTKRVGRNGVVLMSLVVNICVYYMIFVSFPYDAATADTAEDRPFIASDLYITLACALFLGFGDGGFNISVYGALCTIFEAKPAPAFAVFKFVQSIVAAAAFFYCGHLLLPFQLVILASVCILGGISFIVLERALLNSSPTVTTHAD